jgi:hypothetical protein
MQWIPSENQPAQDSFLDIIANIVGILIILGIIVGIRAGRVLPRAEIPSDIADLKQRLETKQAELTRLGRDVQELQAALIAVEREKRLQEVLRDRLAIEVAALERQQVERESVWEQQAAEVARLRAALEERLGQLQLLQARKEILNKIPDEVVQVQHFPAPIARVVDSDEVHFQLQNNRVAHIPLDRLIAQVKDKARAEASRLLAQNEWSDTVGPEGGFRLRFVLRRYDMPVDLPGGQRGTATYIRVEHWVLLPTSPQLGEPVEEALKPDSEFWKTVRQYPPQQYTVTIWVYPESFEAFRLLRAQLHSAGYSCAARPLPAGVPIAGSPRGSKSAAQ